MKFSRRTSSATALRPPDAPMVNRSWKRWRRFAVTERFLGGWHGLVLVPVLYTAIARAGVPAHATLRHVRKLSADIGDERSAVRTLQRRVGSIPMKQLGAIFWKEWHDARWFLAVALLLFIGMPAIGALEARFTYNSRFDLNASIWVIPLGGILAILTAIGITCRDLGSRLEEFWLSR